jgi:hypothetical protein
VTRARAALMSAITLAALAGVLATTALSARKPVYPARVQVVAEEFRLKLSRQTIRPGPVIIELVNFGEDVHDLYLRRTAAGAKTHVIPETLPGKQRQLRTTLVAGRFLLWCSVADHKEQGMDAVLIVKKQATRR